MSVSPVYSNVTWPTNANPSPYEIMNIPRTDFNKITLKKNYVRFAKLYHPDLSRAREIQHHTGRVLDQRTKDERFKIITNAYHLLRDERKKRQYDLYSIGWAEASYQTRPHSTAGYSKAQDAKYWNAGNWDDYRKAEGPRVDPAAARAENMKMVYLLLAAALVSCAAQILVAQRDVEDALRLAWEMEKFARSDLREARDNYGYGLERDERISRFLGHRRFNNHGNRTSALMEAETEDLKVLDELKM
ncbi:hypothetical protein BABINDRAFT_160151 [Babjeviella inositovora NRRL Y-12698]|uniref:J domain-containing protein n=1 Tax=Babjeviella inositovora NRRL Y-12698 TaxID=984486 RepID=A0A1E3QXZ2_9ASCO|nr:uncharacterized protein BABINDRAFT_160151 [Babjeviella inositovora NRRL Y-12698]ODQ81927.1 hypothetical protein BABINDRAFT_160151 [Babjeviella inositovora NRRL Y-12698]